ncbi:hypothetical protein ACXJY6_04645 [Vibrio sp. RC27]
MKTFPFLAKVAGLIWLLAGSIILITMFYMLSKLNGGVESLIIVGVSAFFLLGFAIPGYRVLANKADGLAKQSIAVCILSFGVVFTQQLPNDQFVVFGLLFFSGVIGLVGNKKYKSSIMKHEHQVSEEPEA